MMNDVNTSSTKCIRIGIVDNDYCALNLMAASIRKMDASFQVIWQVESAQGAIEHCVFDVSQPDVIVVDLALEGISGVDVCRRIRARTPSMGIIAVTAYPLHHYKELCIQAGVQALLSKRQFCATKTAEIIRDVAHGRSSPDCKEFHHAKEAYEILSYSEDPEVRLTSRESQILRWYAEGKMTKEIAKELAISEGTIFSHIHHILNKTRTNSRAEAIRKCQSLHLL